MATITVDLPAGEVWTLVTIEDTFLAQNLSNFAIQLRYDTAVPVGDQPAHVIKPHQALQRVDATHMQGDLYGRCSGGSTVALSV